MELADDLSKWHGYIEIMRSNAHDDNNYWYLKMCKHGPKITKRRV